MQHLVGVGQHILHAIAFVAVVGDPASPTASQAEQILTTLTEEPPAAYLAASLLALGSFFLVGSWAVAVVAREGTKQHSGGKAEGKVKKTR